MGNNIIYTKGRQMLIIERKFGNEKYPSDIIKDYICEISKKKCDLFDRNADVCYHNSSISVTASEKEV